MEKNHSKISYTAIICARSLAENTKIPYAKELYHELKTKNLTRWNYYSIIFKLSRFLRGVKLIHSFLEARYLSISETLRKLGNPPVLELASGLSPRGIYYPNLYIETDLKNMISIKKKLLKNLPKREKHILMPLNILNRKSLFKIGKIYLKYKNKPIAIINAGLWTYLTKEEQKIGRDNIRDFLKLYSPKGYWITPDFRPKSLQKNLALKIYRGSITKKTGRPSVRFTSDEEVSSFMNEAGLKLKIASNENIIKNLNTKNKFNLSTEDIKRQTSGMKIYVVQLK